jgi:prophage regulatory protein
MVAVAFNDLHSDFAKSIMAPGTPMMLDLPRVANALSLSESTVQKLVREGGFPEPRQLSGRRVAWLAAEVAAWAASRPRSNLLPPPNTGAPKARR